MCDNMANTCVEGVSEMMWHKRWVLVEVCDDVAYNKVAGGG